MNISGAESHVGYSRQLDATFAADLDQDCRVLGISLGDRFNG